MFLLSFLELMVHGVAFLLQLQNPFLLLLNNLPGVLLLLAKGLLQISHLLLQNVNLIIRTILHLRILQVQFSFIVLQKVDFCSVFLIDQLEIVQLLVHGVNFLPESKIDIDLSGQFLLKVELFSLCLAIDLAGELLIISLLITFLDHDDQPHVLLLQFGDPLTQFDCHELLFPVELFHPGLQNHHSLVEAFIYYLSTSGLNYPSTTVLDYLRTTLLDIDSRGCFLSASASIADTPKLNHLANNMIVAEMTWRGGNQWGRWPVGDVDKLILNDSGVRLSRLQSRKGSGSGIPLW